MGVKVKCRICKQKIERSDAYLHTRVIEKSKKEVREFYCSKNEYDTEMNRIEELAKLKSECFTYVHDDVLQLGEDILIPLSMTKGIHELSKGYPYQVIKGTFKYKIEAIQYAIKTKDFKSDHVKGRYIMAIINSSINDVLAMWNRKLQQESTERSVNDSLDINTYNNMNEEITVKPKVTSGISQFLDEDDM